MVIMPLFGKKKDKDSRADSHKDKASDPRGKINGNEAANDLHSAPKANHHITSSPNTSNLLPAHSQTPTNGNYSRREKNSSNSEIPNYSDEMAQTKPKLIFHCQQAHGSPTTQISGFTNVKELYAAIADAFDIPVAEVMFCTLNTHKVDTTRLLGGQIGLDDFIFAHMKGRPKEVEILKSEEALGLTITDNGAGYAFIKRIKEGSAVSKIEGIFVGDHIEKINGISCVGMRHFEVAKMLKEIPKNTTFLLRVVEPMKSGFSNIGGVSRAGNKKSPKMGTGKETLRLRSSGPATVEVPSDVVDIAIDKINSRLESFLGINDNELAQSIWEIGNKMKNPVEFSEELQKTDLSMFGFSDEFLFEIWGDIGDAKSGRMIQVAQFNEQF